MKEPLSRRRFLAASALLPCGLTAALTFVRPTNLLADLPRPTADPRLKTSLNAFSFLELLNANAKDPKTGIDLFGVCDFCAKQGFDGVDVTGYFFPGYPNAPDDRYLVKLKRHAFDLGLGFSGTGVRNDFTAADPKIRAEGVQRVKTWIEVAAKLGAPTVRAFADSQPPFKDWKQASNDASRDTVEGWVADALRECAEHGEKYGVIVCVQNHGDFISTGAEHVHLLDRVASRWCAAMVDTGKYMTADPYADIALAAPRAVNWHSARGPEAGAPDRARVRLPWLSPDRDVEHGSQGLRLLHGDPRDARPAPRGDRGHGIGVIRPVAFDES
jgi:sugar phosphate isomerase/epimerase